MNLKNKKEIDNQLCSYDYELDPSLIAYEPKKVRHTSRMMIVRDVLSENSSSTNQLTGHLVDELNKGDLIIILKEPESQAEVSFLLLMMTETVLILQQVTFLFLVTLIHQLVMYQPLSSLVILPRQDSFVLSSKCSIIMPSAYEIFLYKSIFLFYVENILLLGFMSYRYQFLSFSPIFGHRRFKILI